MSTMVGFRTAQTAYCLPVQSTRAVRATTGMTALPSARSDVAGIIAGDPPLTVIAPLGRNGSRVLVIEASGKTFGLLVDAVTGLYQIDEARIGDAPEGQARPLVSGTAQHQGQLVLLIDPDRLAARL